MKNTAKIHIIKMTCGGLFLALSVLIPQLFHVFGQTAGQTLLPMHLPVLVAGLFLGYRYGFVIGALSPVLSFLFTGMPAMPRLIFMIIELCVYGAVSGLLYRKASVKLYLSLFGAMIAGRAAYALTLFLAGSFAGFSDFGPYAAIEAVITGLPGIILQIVLVPLLVAALNKGGAHGRKWIGAVEGNT